MHLRLSGDPGTSQRWCADVRTPNDRTNMASVRGLDGAHDAPGDLRSVYVGPP